MHYEFYQYGLLMATGAVAGLLGGMLGIGGSAIMIPAMVLILGTQAAGLDQTHQYMAAAMIVNFLLSIPAVAAHWRNKAIWLGVVKLLMIGGLIGVTIGVVASQFVSGQFLRWFLGAFFLYVAAENITRAIRGTKPGRSSEVQVATHSWVPKISLGLGVGVFAGLTGLGGGALAVPAQQYVLNIPIRNAIANSSALIASMAWLGALVKNMQLASHPQMGSVRGSLILSACLAGTAMIGSYIGGHLTHSLPTRAVRAVFALMILASVPKMLQDLWPAICRLLGM